MRYAKSGSCTSDLRDFCTQGKNLLGENITTGRVLWLRSAWFYDVSTASPVSLYDMTEGSATTSYAGAKKISIPCASGRATMVDFPAPGLKFSTGCAAISDVTTTSGASGSFPDGAIGGAGYEEG